MMKLKSKLDKVNLEVKNTGEVLEDARGIIESIVKEDYFNKVTYLKYKFKNTPYDMTLEEITDYRKIIKSNNESSIRYEKGSFYTAKKIDEELSELISYDTLGILHLISGWTNKSGILIYKNNKPIPSFNKLREKLKIGKSKWGRIKDEILNNSIISESKNREKRNILVINPYYSYTSTEITESRFIAFGDILKDNMPLDEYIFMCRKFDIVPEFKNQKTSTDIDIVEN